MASTTIKSLVVLIVGVICILVSGCALLYVYAFASMVDPSLQGNAYWSVVLAKMFGWTEGLLTWPMLAVFLCSAYFIGKSFVQLTWRCLTTGCS